jgi:membrane-associated protein
MSIPDSLLHVLLLAFWLTWVTVLVVLGSSFVGALLEFLFPPFAGDTLIVLGFIAAVRGVTSPLFVFLWAALGATLGAAVAYEIGKRFGTLPLLERRFRKQRDRICRFLQRSGLVVLILNRFFPGIRALVLPFSGVAGLGRGRALVAATLGNLLFLSFLWIVIASAHMGAR